MQTPTTSETLHRAIGQLFNNSLKVSAPLQILHLIREKQNQRGYQAFDKQDILNELGSLQHLLGQLHRDMVSIDEALKHL